MSRPRIPSTTPTKIAARYLGIIGVLAVFTIGGLAYLARPVPDALAGIAGSAVGALATLLTTTMVVGGRRANDEPPTTTIPTEPAS